MQSQTETKVQVVQKTTTEMLKEAPPDESSLTAPEDRDPTKRWRPTREGALSNEETKLAKKDLFNAEFVTKYSRSERSYADPVIPSQIFGLISFVPAKGAKPNKNGLFGFAKLRGNYSNMSEADKIVTGKQIRR